MSYEWLMLGVGLVLTVGTGVFVASEFALVNLDRRELEARRDRGEKRLSGTINALKVTSTHLSGAQLAITATTLLTGFTFEPAVKALLRTPLLNLGMPDNAVQTVGAVVGVVLATVFSMVLGELIPKNFALALPVGTAKLVMPFQTAFTAVFRPLIVIFTGCANAIIRSFGVEPKEELSGGRSAEELASLVRRSAAEGMLDHDHATLLNRTLRFSQHSAADVLTPRVQMVKVRSGDTAEDIVSLSQSSGHSRFPVIGEDADDIVGFVHVKQAFAVEPGLRTLVRAVDLSLDPLRVPESMGVDTLLGLLRRGGYQVAVVTDEYGGTAGLVTLEDLIEELVGELHDEHDRAVNKVIRHESYVTFDAGLRPDELLDRIGVRVPDDADYDTVAGFVADQLDRIPAVGDVVRVEQGLLLVERVDGSRVDRLRFTPDETAEDDTHDHPQAQEPVGAYEPAEWDETDHRRPAAAEVDHARVVGHVRDGLC